MKVTGMDVIVEGRGTGGHTVEYVLEGGIVVSVSTPKGTPEINRTNAVARAKALLRQIVEEDILPEDMPDGVNQDGEASVMAQSPNSPRDRAGLQRD
ncbi:hypothetical protein ABID21_000809 [Pseudorhizobium tarimense]|uniref:Uncharacterized protein n=1 Tax=Pseudorhizobium tarimense TaxID=1079109 RepID=A0ABV2H2E5_9HYPH|nr:hypothetical protein [Pseudorhizobium tarimense]MCJ8517678.1 hypothetical protein [Pseudorhizobium tarimense]